MSKIEHEVGSGNVFTDLGLANSAEALVKAKLALQIGRIIKARRLTQRSAAALMGVSQAKVSALLRGKLHGVSESKLHGCLNGLGHDVRIVVSPHRSLTKGTTTVVVSSASRAKGGRDTSKPVRRVPKENQNRVSAES